MPTERAMLKELERFRRKRLRRELPGLLRELEACALKLTMVPHDDDPNRVALAVTSTDRRCRCRDAPEGLYQRIANSGQLIVNRMHRAGMTAARVLNGLLVAAD